MVCGLESDDEIVVLEALAEYQSSPDPGRIAALAGLIRRAGKTEWKGGKPFQASTIPGRAAVALAAAAGRSAIRTLILLTTEGCAPGEQFEEGLRLVDASWRKSEEAQQTLSDLLSKPDVARHASTLAWIGDPRAVEKLVPCLDDPEMGASVRVAMLQLDSDWWKRRDVEQQVRQHCASLRDASASDEAVRSLARIGSPAALEPLIRIVADESHPSRSMAELAVFQIVSWPEAADEAERLLGPLLSDRKMRLRLFAANALRSSIGRRCADLLIAWKDDPEYVPRLVAGRLLEKLGIEASDPANIAPAGQTHFCFRCGERLSAAPLPEAYVTPSASGQFPIQPDIEDRPRAGSVCPSCNRILCWTCLGGAEVAACPSCDGPLEQAMPESCTTLIERLQPYWA